MCVGVVCASSFPVRQWEGGGGEGSGRKSLVVGTSVVSEVSVKTEVSKGDSEDPAILSLRMLVSYCCRESPWE